MRRLVLAWAVPALIVLASCSSDPAPIEPKATSSAAAASARPTSTLTPPTLPKQALSKDATGAAAFAGYWIHVLNVAVLTADPTLIETISQPTCKGCESYIRQIESDRKDGIRSSGFRWDPKSASFKESDHVSVVIGAARYRRIGPNDSVTSIAANRYSVGFELDWIGDGWIVRELYIP